MCTEACQTARVDTMWQCTCICGGLYHAGGVAGRGWKPVGGKLLVDSERFWQEYKVGG
jgi:hypothetical protein